MAGRANDAYPPKRAAMYGLALLLLANLVGYLDRQIITLLVNPIKSSLSLGDGAIGLVIGPAFVVTYATAGLFIGRLVDRSNRRRLLIICVTVWTIGAAGGGFAASLGQLFLCRMAVGIGEAALIPTALSLIADSFTPAKRGMATGIFTMGVYIGTGLSLALVAVALPTITDLSEALAAIGYAFEPWRLVMLSMLLPGAITCLFLSTMIEPARRTDLRPDGVTASVTSAWRANIRFLLPHHLGMAVVTLGGYAIAGWFPTVLIREQQLTASQAGVRYGLMVAAVGTLSVYLGGLYSDRCGRLGGLRRQFTFALSCTLVAVAGFAAIGLMPATLLLLVPAACAVGGLAIAMVVGMVSLSNVTPAEVRGSMTAVYFAFTGVIGGAGGPAAVGYANQYLGNADRPLSVILALVGGAAGLLSSALLLVARHNVPSRRAVAEVPEGVSSQPQERE